MNDLSYIGVGEDQDIGLKIGNVILNTFFSNLG